MTDSAASALAIILALGVFLTIVAIGWRSVQNRRILRLQESGGQETIIVAGEDDEVSSLVSTAETVRPEPATTAGSETVVDADADTVARDRRNPRR